jgi:UDP-N-acetylmuramoyl-tripeptide--D-alanyl-D-alanine ligase
MTFGCQPNADIQLSGEEGGGLRIMTPVGEFEPRIPLPGQHNRVNAAAAVAVTLSLGIGLDKIMLGLESVKPVQGRLNFLHTDAGWTVIDDTYNANPASLYSALQVLAGMQGTPWLVLGDMKELGDGSRKMHREVGEAAKAMGVRRLFTTGEMSAYTAEAFGEGAQHFASRDELAKELCNCLYPDVNCLVKGSRSMGMEAIVAAITGAAGMREAG